MGKYIGIDLGTTFSVSAVIDDEGKPKIIKDFLHDATLTPQQYIFLMIMQLLLVRMLTTVV